MYFSPKHLEINVSNQPKYKNSLNKVKLLKKINLNISVR